MSINKVKAGNQPPLRSQAEAKLKEGRPPPASSGWVTGVDALTLLHSLACTPATAGDALKLLHELQVHQVELDLQHEQIEQYRGELTETLERYVERFDFVPVAYFVVEQDGKIIEANVAGAELFGVERSALNGRRIDGLVAAESRFAMLALLKRLREAGSRETCQVRLDGGVLRVLQVMASVAPDKRSFLMVFTDAAGAADSRKLDSGT